MPSKVAPGEVMTSEVMTWARFAALFAFVVTICGTVYVFAGSEKDQDNGIISNKEAITTHIKEWKEYRVEQKLLDKARADDADKRTSVILEAIEKKEFSL